MSRSFARTAAWSSADDAYAETVDAKEEKESQVQELQQKYEKDMKEMREDMEIKFQRILEKIDVRQAS